MLVFQFQDFQGETMTETIPLPMYGVWLRGKGWVRGANNQAYADYNKTVAKQVAQRIGNSAKVYYIDASLVDLEEKLLQAERDNAISWLSWKYIKR